MSDPQTSSSPFARIHCRASPSLWLALIVASMVLLGLACWQLSKGLIRTQQDEMQAQVQQIGQPQSLAQSITFWQAQPESIQDMPIEITGEFNQRQFLLHDNRILHGQAGYAVYGLLELTQTQQAETQQATAQFSKKELSDADLSDEQLSGLELPYTHMLINLGWHALPRASRQLMPKLRITPRESPFDAVQSANTISLTLEHIYPNIFTLNTAPPERFQQHAIDFLRVQTIDFAAVNKMLGINLVPFVGRATSTQTDPSLTLFDQPVGKRGISAAKHYGYSAQWFIFWCIAVGVFIYTQCCYDRKLH